MGQRYNKKEFENMKYNSIVQHVRKLYDKYDMSDDDAAYVKYLVSLSDDSLKKTDMLRQVKLSFDETVVDDRIETMFDVFKTDSDDDIDMAPGMFNNFLYAIAMTQLSKRDVFIIMLYIYGFTFEAIGNVIGVTTERVRQLIVKAVRKLKHPSRFNILEKGINSKYETHFKEGYKNGYQDGLVDKYSVEGYRKPKLSELSISELELTVRAHNCLRRARIDTLEDLFKLYPEDLLRVRNLGKKCMNEIISKALIYAEEHNYNTNLAHAPVTKDIPVTKERTVDDKLDELFNEEEF